MAAGHSLSPPITPLTGDECRGQGPAGTIGLPLTIFRGIWLVRSKLVTALPHHSALTDSYLHRRGNPPSCRHSTRPIPVCHPYDSKVDKNNNLHLASGGRNPLGFYRVLLAWL